MTMLNTLKQFLFFSTLFVAFFSRVSDAFPALNFTNTVLTNRMIEALNEALLARDRQQLLTSLQTFQEKYQQPSYQQLFSENQYHPGASNYPQEYADFYPGQIFAPQGQQQPSYSQHFPEQQPSYSQHFPEQQPSNGFYQNPFAIPQGPAAIPSGPGSAYQPQVYPEASQGNMFDGNILQKPDSSNYQPLPQIVYQPHNPDQQYPSFAQPPFLQQPEQHPQLPQHLPVQPSHGVAYPQHIPNPHQPTNVHVPQLSPVNVHPPANIHQPVNFHPTQQFPDPIQPVAFPQNIPAGAPGPVNLHPVTIPEHSQPIPPLPASHHPTQYQPQNWLNPSHPWGSGAVDPHEPKPIQVIHAEPAIPLAGECPVGFCPLGATCSQNSGQWQCGCGQNACAGVENPCGLFGRYYFPYYPDASRFIQCDQTGVFWIRKCAPGTIFDPRISVCNFPPVMIEPGKK